MAKAPSPAPVPSRGAAGYLARARKHLTPELGRVRLSKLCPQHFQGPYRKLLDGGLAPSTVAHVHATARAALSQAVRWGMVGRNVVTLEDSPGPTSPEKCPSGLEQVELFLSGRPRRTASTPSTPWR